MHAEAWRHGFSELTAPSKHRMDMQKDFIGNVLDFVSSDIGEQKLMDFLPHLIGQQFTMFMFGTKKAATIFLRRVSGSPEFGGQVFATVVNGEMATDLVCFVQLKSDYKIKTIIHIEIAFIQFIFGSHSIHWPIFY